MTEANDPTQAGTACYDAEGTLCLSRNEIESLCAKAARGAGMAWGLAEEAGFACGWLAARGVDGAGALLAHLERVDGRQWTDMSPTMGKWSIAGQGPLCPIHVGAALSDDASALAKGIRGSPLCIEGLAQPVLVLPFVAHLARDLGAVIGLEVETCAVQVGPDGTLTGAVGALAKRPVASVSLRIRTAPLTDQMRAPTHCTSQTIAALNAYALRTTVPPSDKSRADAGAGESDND